jgi:ketosteroid isomerase-like protein
MGTAAGTETREVVERMYTAAGSGDMAELREILAEDVVIEAAPFVPYGGTYRGFEEFVGCFGKAAELIDFSRLQLDGITADGVHAYGRVRVPFVDGSGEANILEEWTVRDGRVVAGRVFYFDQP